MVVTIQTSKETAKMEALVEAATANIYGIYMEAGEREMSVKAATANIYGLNIEAGEREMSADRTETGDKTKTERTGIKKETQATITEATRSGRIMILESRIRK